MRDLICDGINVLVLQSFAVEKLNVYDQVLKRIETNLYMNFH